MRQQNNTLHDFLVLMTEKGVVPVDDPQQIAVYDCLCAKGKLRPIEIAESLGCPSSSLHFVLEKMLDNGIIVKSKPDPVRKGVFYSVLSTELMRYVPPTPEQASDSEEMFKNPQSYFSGLASVSNLLDVYLFGMGLDYSVIRKNYVKDLADSIKGTIGTGSLDDVVPVIKEVFGSITTYRMGIFSLSPLTVVLEGDRTIRNKLEIFADFICRMVENATGKRYALESIEDYSSDDNYRYKVTMGRVTESDDVYLNTSLQQNDPAEFFLLDVDGQATMLASDIQVKILKSIYDRPLCVSDVTSVVDLPRSTVTTNLLRMLENGIVSVFYAENGAIYYGLNCAVLMMRNRKMAKDHGLVRAALHKAVENGFMEGMLTYTLAYLRELGFDTSYAMVSLGAKYMRVAGKDSPKNFDAYFDRICNFGSLVGLGMTVTSVYPLTIGVSKTGDLPGPMLSFAKGMVHQGLEMASSGMFLRVSEEDDNEVKVSFKEIYPPISATPPAGVDAEMLESAMAEKKRTSSVRAAIRNRSIRSGKPSRTMRYISSVVMVAILAVAVLFAVGAGNGDNVAYGDVCALDVDDSGIVLYDTNGDEMDLPYVGTTNTAVTFSIELSNVNCVGIVKDGIAYPIEQAFISSNNGFYTAVLDRNLTITELRLTTVSDGLTANLYDFGRTVSAEEAYFFQDYIPADKYMSESGDLWISKDTWVSISSPDDCYVSVSGNDTFYFDRIVVEAWDPMDLNAVSMPDDYAVLTIEGAYEAVGCYVVDSLRIQKDVPAEMKFITTDGPISITLDEGGKITPLMVDEDRFITVIVAQDAELEYDYVRIK